MARLLYMKYETVTSNLRINKFLSIAKWHKTFLNDFPRGSYTQKDNGRTEPNIYASISLVSTMLVVRISEGIVIKTI